MKAVLDKFWLLLLKCVLLQARSNRKQDPSMLLKKMLHSSPWIIKSNIDMVTQNICHSVSALPLYHISLKCWVVLLIVCAERYWASYSDQPKTPPNGPVYRSIYLMWLIANAIYWVCLLTGGYKWQIHLGVRKENDVSGNLGSCYFEFRVTFFLFSVNFSCIPIVVQIITTDPSSLPVCWAWFSIQQDKVMWLDYKDSDFMSRLIHGRGFITHYKSGFFLCFLDGAVTFICHELS